MSIRRWLVLGLTAALALGACGGDGDDVSSATTEAETTTTTSGADRTMAETEIRTNFEAFFSPTGTLDAKVALLENGERYRGLIKQSLDTGQAAGVSVKVKTITFESDTRATLAFDLFLGPPGPIPTLADSPGVAVLVDGKWKVAEETNCSLLTLGNNGTPPAPCPTG